MYQLQAWTLNDNGISDEDRIKNGNRFLSGNGCLGYRGTLEEADASELPATIMNGLYDRQGQRWREPVNLPNALSVRSYTSDGAALTVNSPDLHSHYQQLDFRYGLYSRQSSWKREGIELCIETERFVSMKEPDLLCLKYSISVSSELTLRLERGIDCLVHDINGPHLDSFNNSMVPAAKGSFLFSTSRTLEKNIPVSIVSASVFSGKPVVQTPLIDSLSCYESLNLLLGPSAAMVLYVYSSVRAHAFLDVETEKLKQKEFLTRCMEKGFDGLKHEHTRVWDKIWDMGDVKIEGNPDDQAAVRYNLYQLQISAPRFSQSLSIPARGLSGQTYKGAVFWDTELFIAPYFLATDPDIVRSFIMYRIDGLEGARKKAVECGYRGAFFAWESHENGEEACSYFNVVDVFTGRPVRTYFRDKQIHISADIVFAIEQYIGKTNDTSILKEGALELILECARFYISYILYSPYKKRFEIHDVVGPDEYHERVNNNAFTNRMVKFVLETALHYLETFRSKDPAYLDLLLQQLDYYSDSELIRESLNAFYIPAPGPDGIIEQFDSYFSLEELSMDQLRQRILDPKEYLGGPDGPASHTRIIKQADVVLLLNLFSHEYSPEVLGKNLLWYEKRTEHGSSLSSCMYALLACKTGDSDRAYSYFKQSAYIDIAGSGKQFAGLVYIGGTHPAASGGTWLTVIHGFCGLEYGSDEIHLNPRLPASWNSVEFKCLYKGKRYTIHVTKNGVELC